MRVRIVLWTLVFALVAALGLRLATGWHPAARSAAALAGERWYRITLEDTQIGYLYSHARRDWLGRWRFESDLRFTLQAGVPVRIAQTLEFAALPPFALRTARQISSRGGAETDRSELVRAGRGLRWQRPGRTGQAPDRTSAPIEFALGDYLAVEGWLRTQDPSAGASIALPALDFGSQRRVTRRYRVLARDLNGWEIENPAPHEATRITLDPALRPIRMNLAGLFDLEQVDREVALAPRTAFQSASYHIPLDRRLEDHTRLTRLTLTVAGSVPAEQFWPALINPREQTLTLASNTPSGLKSTGEELLATTQHPVDDSRVRRLARTIIAPAHTPTEQVAALTDFVHRFIRYQEDAPPRHVLALLDDPVGNCNAYADLLTTLARSIGIPARTVFGLAYADGELPAFRFHAWNELALGDTWQPVDPTWNQLETDATHLPMPLDVATALTLLTGGGQLFFTVRATAY